MNIFNDLAKFKEERGLNNVPFDLETYLRKDLEEMFELMGYPESFCKAQGKNLAIDLLEARDGFKGPLNDSKHYRVDAIGDRIVFAVEAIEQLGYNAEIAMDEIQKEINSRDGEIINGKFEKFKTPEAMSKWYKANFDKAVKR